MWCLFTGSEHCVFRKCSLCCWERAGQYNFDKKTWSHVCVCCALSYSPSFCRRVYRCHCNHWLPDVCVFLLQCLAAIFFRAFNNKHGAESELSFQHPGCSRATSMSVLLHVGSRSAVTMCYLHKINTYFHKYIQQNTLLLPSSMLERQQTLASQGQLVGEH